jgi:hypothetical protein
VSRAAAFLVALAAVGQLGVGAHAQKPGRTDPASCPYCGGDPDVMARAGIVSHGPFEFGSPKNDTETVGAFLLAPVFWIESEHHEIGFALGPYKVTQKEKEKIRAELTRLAEVLPNVDPRRKILDEWLRAHLFAQRAEDAYARFLEIVRKTPDDFPRPGEPWILGDPFRGIGPHLGQAGKYEVLLLETEAEHVAYLKEQFGLSIKRTQRWNVVERDSLNVTLHIRQGDLKIDSSLHGHVVFNLAHNYLDGFEHYSYDTPLWLHEGLAHLMEREVGIRYNSFDATEGALAETTREDEWVPEARKLASSGEAPRMAELVSLQSYAAFELRHHFTTWSMVDFLLREHPEGLACLFDTLKGRVKADGTPDGENLRDVHRDAFQSCLGMSYPAFDAAWKEWLSTQIDRKD